MSNVSGTVTFLKGQDHVLPDPTCQANLLPPLIKTLPTAPSMAEEQDIPCI